MSNKRFSAVHSVPIWLTQTETWLYDQVRFLSPDIENHVVCEETQHLDQFPFDNIHSLEDVPWWQDVWDRGIRKLGFRHHLNLLIKEARKAGAQLLHSHFGDTGWRDMGAARRLRMKHVVTFYGIDVNHLPTIDPRWNDRYRELFKHVDLVLCEGPHMAQCVIGLGCPDQKVRVHHLGVNVDRIDFEPRTWGRGEPLRVLIASTFREKKGIPYAMDALGRLSHEVPVEITIIGDAHGTPETVKEKEKIQASVENNNLGPETRMIGFQPHSEVFKEAYRHHIFLSPSVTASNGDTEGGAPVSIIEMSASGMPIVSTKHCDIPGVILDGVTGLLAEERDVEGLVKHLKWYVEHPEQWQKMLIAGRKHIESEFNVRVQGERLSAIYRELIEDLAHE